MKILPREKEKKQKKEKKKKKKRKGNREKMSEQCKDANR